jgi:hypothetical protein
MKFDKSVSNPEAIPVYPIRNFFEQSLAGIPKAVSLEIYYRYNKNFVKYEKIQAFNKIN